MAHAAEEVADMASIASALVLNIGTLTRDFVDSMIKAALSANSKGIPVVLDVCGAGATPFRDDMCFRILNECRIDVIKGNCSEIAKIAGENVITKGVDSGEVTADMKKLAFALAKSKDSIVVVTGAVDIVTDGKLIYEIFNGHEMMSHVVGTGCMATSVIGTFAAISQNRLEAIVSGLCCFEIAAELAVSKGAGPGSFINMVFDEIYSLNKDIIQKMQRVNLCKDIIL